MYVPMPSLMRLDVAPARFSSIAAAGNTPGEIAQAGGQGAVIAACG